MPVYGATLLNLSLGLAVLTLVALFFYVRGGDYRLFQVGQRASLGVSFLVLLATVTLITNLLQGNFDVDYVAKYTSQATPVLYKLSALWAGQSGSLLFWLFILSIYSVIVVIQNRSSYHDLMPYVIITLTVIQLFFLFLVLILLVNPFSTGASGFCGSGWSGTEPSVAESYHGYPSAYALSGLRRILCPFRLRHCGPHLQET